MQRGMSVVSLILTICVLIFLVLQGLSYFKGKNDISIIDMQTSNQNATSSSLTEVRDVENDASFFNRALNYYNHLYNSYILTFYDGVVNIFNKEPKKTEWYIEQMDCPSGEWHVINTNSKATKCTIEFIHDNTPGRVNGPELREDLWQVYLFDVCDDALRQHARGYCYN